MNDQAFALRELVKAKQSEKARDLKNSRRASQVIYAVASGKGGVGKTNISVNLGISFSQSGKSVLVLDADLGMSNVNLILGENVRKDIYNVFKGQDRLDEVIYPSKFGIDFISGGSGLYDLANLTGSEQDRFVEQMRYLDRYDVIIIDIGAGISRTVTSFLRAADIALIVTTPEPTAMTDAYGLIKALNTSGCENELRLIVNRVSTDVQGIKVYEKMKKIAQQFLKIDLKYGGFIFQDSVVEKSLYKSTPFLIYEPKAKASLSLSRVADGLDETHVETVIYSGISGFLKKILSAVGN